MFSPKVGFALEKRTEPFFLCLMCAIVVLLVRTQCVRVQDLSGYYVTVCNIPTFVQG